MPVRRTLLIVLLAMALVACGPARGAPLRPVASGVTALATDDERYVAWESAAERAERSTLYAARL